MFSGVFLSWLQCLAVPFIADLQRHLQRCNAFGLCRRAGCLPVVIIRDLPVVFLGNGFSVTKPLTNLVLWPARRNQFCRPGSPEILKEFLPGLQAGLSDEPA